ncbi:MULTISPECIES: hypothetical protein [Actinoalloteichus]|uniref:Uncharacterized protein n=1 Tax=Actinoalloteichus fjordicus TaxID=1612552 RepID=A0AAC9PR28_9PSEU|nr:MULTISPECIES: hypothetical protein [Actinoalloteichus]APU13401.1 hypothetical protein UA74_06640 [Actinoalloteichus fjordicus]APU19351.1 hypothetical protein UA75_06640 [Actinoalloteichus sp. GBA129-24]
MARTKRVKDLTGIRARGSRYQVRVFTGYDPNIGKAIMVTRSAKTEDEAIKIRDRFLGARRGTTRDPTPGQRSISS